MVLLENWEILLRRSRRWSFLLWRWSSLIVRMGLSSWCRLRCCLRCWKIGVRWCRTILRWAVLCDSKTFFLVFCDFSAILIFLVKFLFMCKLSKQNFQLVLDFYQNLEKSTQNKFSKIKNMRNSNKYFIRCPQIFVFFKSFWKRWKMKIWLKHLILRVK